MKYLFVRAYCAPTGPIRFVRMFLSAKDKEEAYLIGSRKLPPPCKGEVMNDIAVQVWGCPEPTGGKTWQASHEGHLYEDSKWKERGLSRLETFLDDGRNPMKPPYLGDLGDGMEHGKNYRVIMTVEEIPDK